MLARKAARDLLRSKGQFAALTAMIVLGVASLVGVYGGYANLQDAIDAAYEAQAFHDGLVEFTPRARDGLPDFDAIAGIADWQARRRVELPVDFGEGAAPVLASLVSLPDGPLDQLEVREGGMASAGGIVAEAGFADHHGLVPGDALAVAVGDETFRFSLAGIATSPEYLWPAKTVQEHMPDVLRRWGVLWLPAEDLEALLADGALVNQVVFTAEDPARVHDVLRRVGDAMGPASVVRLEARDTQASNVVLGLLVNGLNQIAFVLPLLFLTIVGLSSYVFLTRLVHQQRANIGLLRALGYTPRAILWHFLGYAPLIAGAGAVLGFAVGHGLSYYVTDVFASYVTLRDIPVRLRPDLFIVGLGLSLLFTGLASLLPARQASRMRPAEAMRPPAPSRAPRAWTTSSHVAPGTLPLPVLLGVRSLARNPRRAAFTTLGLCLAVGVMVVPLGFLDSLDATVDRAVVQVQRADETLLFARPVPMAELSAAASHDGVQSLEPLVQLQAAILVEGRPVGITVLGLSASGDLLRLHDADGHRAAVDDRGILLSRVFERDGLRRGDVVRLFGEDVPVLGFVQATGTTGFVALPTAQRWAGLEGAVNQALLLRQTDASAARVHEDLAIALPIAATQDTDQALADTRSMLRLYYGFIFLLVGFSLAIGAAIVFNAVTINVLEESRDFATLRTMGVPLRTLVAQTTTETLLLATPGVLVGLLLGRLLTSYFVGVFSTDLFVLDLFVAPATYALALAAGLGVALASQLPSLRWVGRMDLARSVRERSG